MRRPDASPTVRLPSGNTPLRVRNPDGAVAHGHIQTQRVHKDNSTQRRTLSPNKLNATRKPFISPKLTNERSIGGTLRRIRNECVNHPDREAEFKLTVSGENMEYCEKCAAQLASQGFKVERIGAARRQRISLGSNVCNRYQGHPRAVEVSQFLRNLKEVDHCLRENSRSLMDIQNHYAIQIRQLEQFYNGIVCYVNYIRNQHVGILKEQSRKYVQIGLIQYGNNEETLEEIGFIVHDIESQMQSIVTAISEQKFRECLGEYSKNLQMYRHKLEEQNNTMGQVSNVRVDELEAKIIEIKRSLSNLLGIKEQSLNSNHFSFEGSKQSNPSAKRFFGKENHGPFRNLFESNEQFLRPDDSPQFKAQ